MTQLDYKIVKACYDANKLLSKYGIRPVKISDRVYQVDRWGLGSGTVYSQQEVTIFRESSFPRSDFERNYQHNRYPAGIKHIVFKYPEKQYISFADSAGTTRYYVIPRAGLRIKPDGPGYKAMNPMQDYHIEVDRAAAKASRKQVEDLIEYLTVMWDLIPAPESYNDRPQYTSDVIPEGDCGRELWFDYLLAAKYARYGSLALSTVLSRIRDHYTEKALAYQVTPVPDTKTDHTEHWNKLDSLRDAGKLVMYEGKPRKKRKKKLPKEEVQSF